MITGKVRELMVKKGMTIREMAERTGLATETIKRSRDARIGQCTLNTLAAIAGALGCRAKDLFEERWKRTLGA